MTMQTSSANDGAISAGVSPTMPRIISVDDHVVEPAHLWQTWLPAKLRERGPRVERRGIAATRHVGPGRYAIDWSDDGEPADCWVFDEVVYVHKRNVAIANDAAGEAILDPAQRTLASVTYDEMRAGCYDPAARLADMDLNHVDKSLCFPTFPRFCGQTFLEATPDRELGLACVVAYNDWMIEEWCGDSAGRLLPLCLVPLWDPVLAAAEVRRNAARGCRAVAFSEIPPHLGLPSIHTGHWDPLFQACEETGTVVCMHIGSSSKMPITSADAPAAVGVTLTFNNSMASLADFLFSGVLVRFPALKLAYSEGQIGWLPYVLERADDVWVQQRGWTGADAIPESPSTYYYRQVYGCFFRDRHGVQSLLQVGVGNVTFETDYPHGDSTWPNTLEVASAMFAGLPPDIVYKIVRGNAARMFGLDDAVAAREAGARR